MATTIDTILEGSDVTKERRDAAIDALQIEVKQGTIAPGKRGAGSEWYQTWIGVVPGVTRRVPVATTGAAIRGYEHLPESIAQDTDYESWHRFHLSAAAQSGAPTPENAYQRIFTGDETNNGLGVLLGFINYLSSTRQLEPLVTQYLHSAAKEEVGARNYNAGLDRAVAATEPARFSDYVGTVRERYAPREQRAA